MAEFCLECFNKYSKEKLAENDVIMDIDLCEGCGEIKPCVIRRKENNIFSSIKSIVRRFFRL